VNIEQGAYDEIVGRLVDLHKLAAELVQAYDDPVMKDGAEEMRASLERVLQLLGRK
jgi:hypothetical protein